MVVADFGSGSGHFSIEAGRKVGEEGLVYAVDIRDSALESLRSQARRMGLRNIELIKENLEAPGGSGLDSESVDLVFLINILFQSRLKEKIISEAYRVLKRGGRLLAVDWLPDAALGPREGQKVSAGEMQNISKGEGFSFVNNIEVGSHHYGMIFKKI